VNQPFNPFCEPLKSESYHHARDKYIETYTMNKWHGRTYVVFVASRVNTFPSPHCDLDLFSHHSDGVLYHCLNAQIINTEGI
jgi:hypothetical protein